MFRNVVVLVPACYITCHVDVCNRLQHVPFM
jgi:hypothetical protein